MSEINIGPVRFSYLTIFEPEDKFNTGKKRFSATLLIDKKNKRVYKELMDAIESAIKDGVKNKFNGQRPKKLKLPVHDGDGQRDNGEDYGQECKGMWVVSTSAQETSPPEIVAGRDQHPAGASEVYSGCYGYANINLSAYNYNGNRGIGAYINNIWKTKDGEPLAGRKKSAAQAFANLTDIEFDDPDDDLEDIFEGLE